MKATAVKIGKGTEVLEVKRNGVVGRKVYTSVEAWKESLEAPAPAAAPAPAPAPATPSKGSLIRITTTSGSTATAVKIGEGAEVLEVKRNGVAGRKLYTSVAEWENSFGADTINERSVEEKTAAAASDRPVRSRPAPLPAQNADIAFMQQLYKDYNKTCRTKLKPAKVERWVNAIDIFEEVKRLYALTPTPYSESTLTLMKSYIERWTHLITDPYYANTKSANWTYSTGRTFYVRDPATGSLCPILLGKSNGIDSHNLYNAMYTAVSHLYAIPNQDWICYKGKVGNTFTEVGVPVGADGKPELLVTGGRWGAITRYVPTA
jgi:hypothetical protein